MSQQKVSKSRVTLGPSASAYSRTRTDLAGEARARSLSRLKVRKQSYGFSGIAGVGPQRKRSSMANYEADEESRRVNPDTECELSDLGCQRITKSLGRTEIDLFASLANAECQDYVPWRKDSDTFAIDAFTVNWNNKFFYAWGTSIKELVVPVFKCLFHLFLSVFKKPYGKLPQSGMEFRRPAMMYLNTYQMEPYVKFHVPHVTKAINSALDLFYTDFKYNATDAPIKAMFIADQVMRSVKEMNFNRYRIISVVTLAQKRAQCYNNAVAFLWDQEFDNIVDVHRESSRSFIQVTCFGIYLD